MYRLGTQLAVALAATAFLVMAVFGLIPPLLWEWSPELLMTKDLLGTWIVTRLVIVPSFFAFFLLPLALWSGEWGDEAWLMSAAEAALATVFWLMSKDVDHNLIVGAFSLATFLMVVQGAMRITWEEILRTTWWATSSPTYTYAFMTCVIISSGVAVYTNGYDHWFSGALLCCAIAAVLMAAYRICQNLYKQVLA